MELEETITVFRYKVFRNLPVIFRLVLVTLDAYYKCDVAVTTGAIYRAHSVFVMVSQI